MNRTRLRAATGALALLGTVAAVAVAQDPAAPPTLAYTLTKGKAPSGPTTVAPGVVTFSAKAAKAKQQRDLQLFRVADGVTDIPALQKKLSQIRSGDTFEKLGTLTLAGGAGGATSAKAAKFTRTLAPGTYLVGDFTDDATPSTVLTVTGAPTAAVAPPVASTVTMFDYKFEVDRKLPRKGAVRVVNKGKRNHFYIAFKAGDRKGAAKLDKALRKNDEKTAQKFIRGTGTYAGIVGAGESVDIAAEYAKGTYVLVCFWESKQSKGRPHNVLGMSRIVQAG